MAVMQYRGFKINKTVLDKPKSRIMLLEVLLLTFFQTQYGRTTK